MDLRHARQALGWTQQELAAKSGVPQQIISRIERGKTERLAYRSIVKLVRTLRKAGLVGITQESLFPIAEDE
jgi:transcriptional regulator with XRE-family HTH domain